MTRLLTLLIWALAAAASGGENLVRNPSFEGGVEEHGLPAEWRWSGDGKHVVQTLTLDKGRDGKQCARLACTRFEQRNAACHAMICQMGVQVQRGKAYRVSLWARGEDIGSEVVSIALADTAGWADCGLQGSLLPTPTWTRYEFVFHATRDCSTSSRLQIWFGSTGTLWLDDVVFEEAGRELRRPGHVIPAKGHKNLIPNASFECGDDGWGSAEWDRAVHWGGRMNRLFGEISDQKPFDGGKRIHVELTPENQPVSYFDYYELSRLPIRAPLVANLGYLEVEPGEPYVFSAYLYARGRKGRDQTEADDAREIPARLAVRQFDGRTFEKLVRVSGMEGWQRFSLPFKPTSGWCYVAVGPDLRVTKESPEPPNRATLWIDALQLERGSQPTDFQPREPVEFGLSTGRLGNVLAWNDLLEIRVTVVKRDRTLPAPKFVLSLTDFFGKEVWRESAEVEEAKAFHPQMGRQRQLRGFLRLHAKMTCGDIMSEKTMRLAVIPEHQGKDSRFGVNHAYPWPHLLDLSRKAGLVWVRDWSLKWQEVEPQQGQFTFAETDFQIDRPLGHGLRVLGLLPFPSSNWSSSAPASVEGKGGYPRNRERVAYAPRDEAEFESYVQRTVKHYKNRVAWWQCFNEPLYTDYSLPRQRGYDGVTYAKLTKAFARAARRADPSCRVLAGIGAIHEGQIMEDFDKFFGAGGLEAVDAVDIHHYPGMRPPEFIEDLLVKLNGLMQKHGGRKPIWLTEYGYYANDEPWALPMPSHGFDTPLPSEQTQAEYAVRWATIMLAHGVDKVFYHAGTCGGINQGNLEGIFYQYGGQPQKIYAAQAVMAHLLTPTCKFVKPLPLAGGVKGYLFRDGQRTVGVIWAPSRAKPTAIRLANDKLELWDLMGRPQPARQFTPSGAPVYVIGEGVADRAWEELLDSLDH